jgi:hypothetical protein
VGQRQQVLQPVPAVVLRLARPRWLLSAWLRLPELVSALRPLPGHSLRIQTTHRVRSPQG